MLLELSKKNNLWIHYAKCICGNKDIANEVVQRMYLRIYDYNVDFKKLTDTFVKVVIYNVFKDYIKENKKTVFLDDKYINVTYNEKISNNFNDKELTYLNRADRLTEDEKKTLMLNYDYSIGELSKIKDTRAATIHSRLDTYRIEILGKNYSKEYKNKRKK